MQYIEHNRKRWSVQTGRDADGHCAWLTNAETGERLPRDDFERKRFADEDPDFSGFDTASDLFEAIKKWAAMAQDATE
jgi:hypothetical protein